MSGPRTPRRRRFGPKHAAASAGALLLVHAIVLLFSFHDADPDVWGRLAVGRLIAETGRVPTEDVFAYVPTKSPWVDHEWLSGLVFHELWERWGGRGLVVLRAALGLAAWALLYAAARSAGAAPWCIALLGVAGLVLFAQGANGVVRAQAFSFAFFGLFLVLLERARGASGAATLLLVPATALWANLHGGFVVGVILVGVYAAGAFAEGDRRVAIRLALLAAACLLASLANPYGLDYWRYLSGALGMQRPEIVEWRSVEWAGLADPHLKLSALAVVLTMVLGRGASPPFAHRALLAGTLVASLLHVRFAPFLALVLPLALARPLEHAFDRSEGRRRLGRSAGPLILMLCLQLLVLLGLAVSFRERDLELRMNVPTDRYPVAAVRRLAEIPSGGRLAVSFQWGEYALYHLYPRFRVSFDGRYETVYPENVARANFDFLRGRAGGGALLELYPADFALYPRRSAAAGWLARAPGWTLLVQDEAAALYRRSGEPTDP